MERFWPRLLQGTAPLWVWASHFAFCYLFVAVACSPGGGAGWRWLVLTGVTLCAIATCAVLLWRTCHRPLSGLLAVARLLSALLACVALGWSGLVLLLTGYCG